MMRLIFSLFFVLLNIFSMAQDGWNWSRDADLKKQAIEKQAYYKILIVQGKYDEAMKPLDWLYKNNPDLNPSIYIDGVKCLESMIKTSDSEERKERLQDSLLWMYDQRIEYFDNHASIMDRKVFKAFRFHYKTPSKYAELIKMFEQAYEMNGLDISYFNLNIYMLLAKQYYEYDPVKMPAIKVLDIHSQISNIIDEKLKNSGKKDKLIDQQNKTDAWLSSISGILNCQFIKNKLVAKFRSNPKDLETAKKIFKYSVQAKCTHEPYFLEVSELVFRQQPSYALASVIGSKYLAIGEVDKALQHYEEAETLARNDDEKFETIMGQAVANSKLGNKSRSRTLAYEALGIKSGSFEGYNLIGYLYFTSYDDCRGDKSKVMDRGVFLAAYKMYEKAGNEVQMQACKEQFPSVEEIFNEGMRENQSITVGCWINETVTLQRR